MKTAIFVLLSSVLLGQSQQHLLTIIPDSTRTTTGEIQLRDKQNPAHFFGFRPPDSMGGANLSYRLWTTDTFGCVTSPNTINGDGTHNLRLSNICDPTVVNAVCDGVTNDGPVIAAALAALPMTGGTVKLPPGKICAVATSRDVTIPASMVVFDCQGSTILYTAATGQAVYVSPFASDVPYISGVMRNCRVTDGNGSPTSSTGIWQESRLGMKYENLTIRGFNGSTSTCMTWENSATSPQFTEQTTVRVMDTFDCTEHLRMINTGGTNSFAYNTIEDWHCSLINPNTGCLMADGSGSNSILMFGDSIHLRVNGNGTGPMYTVKLTNGAVIERQSIQLLGELTTGAGPLYSVWTDANSELYAPGEINITGGVMLAGGAGQTSASVPLPVDPITGVAGWWAGGGILPQRKCKYGFGWPNTTTGNGGDFKAYLASYGGTENNCSVQFVKRATDNTNVDVNVQGSGPAELNILYLDSLSGKVGFGPSFGWGSPPIYYVDALGASMRTPNTVQLGNSTGFHFLYSNTNADQSFQLLMPTGAVSAAFIFAIPFNNPPNCVATPNTTMYVTGGNPKIGTFAITPAVNGVTIVQEFLNTSAGTVGPSTFDVTYFVHCSANGS
jgi:hypothetical protein